MKGKKTYEYQNKSIINLIGWQVYDMGSMCDFLTAECPLAYCIVRANSQKPPNHAVQSSRAMRTRVAGARPVPDSL